MSNKTTANTVVQQKTQKASFLGSGWKFPPTFEGTTGRLEMTFSEDNINQSIDVILGTQQGARGLIPQFGSILKSYVFQTVNQSLKTDIITAVKTALLNNEPRIRVETVTVEVADSLNPTLVVNIGYSVIQTNSRHNHVYPFSLTEANNLAINTGGL